MNSYLQSIQIAVLIFFAFLLVALIPYMIFQYRREGQVYPWRFLVSFSFILYMISAYALTIFPLPSPASVAKLTTPTENLQLFEFVREFIKYSPFRLNDIHTWLPALKDPSFIQPFCNLLMTVPFGFYLNYRFKKKFTFSLVISFLLTLSFELIQRSALFGLYPRPYRLFDVDDLLLNTLGALLGFALAALLGKYLPDLNARKVPSSSASLSRRFIAFVLDGVLAALISLFMNWPFVSQAVVFLLAPLIFQATVGQMIVKISFGTEKRYKILLRQLLSFANFVPLYFFGYFLARSGTIPESQLGQNYLLILLSLGLLGLVLFDLLFARLTGSHLLWYERLSKTELKAK